MNVRYDANGNCVLYLPLDVATLNERLFEIGIWLAERGISHRTHIVVLPDSDCIRIRFRADDGATAFRALFGGTQ